MSTSSQAVQIHAIPAADEDYDPHVRVNSVARQSRKRSDIVDGEEDPDADDVHVKCLLNGAEDEDDRAEADDDVHVNIISAADVHFGDEEDDVYVDIVEDWGQGRGRSQ
jgi:hypothetical protein